MKVTSRRARLVGVLGLVASGALALSACGSDNTAGTGTPSSAGSSVGTSPVASTCATGSASGGGSTFQQNIELQWIKDYQQQCSGATLAYAGTGSGAGKSSFGNGTVDWAGSDSDLKASEQAAADKRCGNGNGTGNRAIQTPITAGAAVLTYNLGGVDNLQLSAPTIAGIFEGKITSWDAPQIKADNPGVALPPTKIVPVHRSDKSGTTNIFSSFLRADAGAAWTLGSGETLDWPGGQSGNGSNGTTTAVKQIKGGITYTELSFAKLNNLPFAKIKNAAGDYVAATGDSVSAGLADAKVDTTHGDIRVVVDYASTNPAAYPLSAVTYVITCNAGNKNAALLKGFFSYALNAGTAVDDELGYAPLPHSIATAAKAQVASIR